MKRGSLLLVVWLAVGLAAALAASSPKTRPVPMTEHERALHALNRLTFGPRPGDLEYVLGMGVDHWIDQQLNPDQIPNNASDARIGGFRTLRMQSKDLVQTFPTNGMIKDAADGKRPPIVDPIQAGLWEIWVARYRDQQKPVATPPPTPPTPEEQAAQRAAVQDVAKHVAQLLLSLPREKRMSTLMQLPISDRLAFAGNLPGDLRDKLLADFSPQDKEVYFAMNSPINVVISELQQAKILRAIYSERQLQEVMTDFWFNHFNIFVNKDADSYLVTSYERDVIRPHALGKFQDLLVTVAKSPAMMVYLDNWLSMGPNSPAAGGKPGQPQPSGRGLNENYGRELMELHTVGVNGGYTQKDVTEVARVFTGWTVGPLEQGAVFAFDPRKHEPGPKTVLGQTIPPTGQNEGLQVLEMLAANPKTAQFVCTKLARRFVADDPPASLVQQMADTFLSSDGDIREVLRTMFRSKEFWSPTVYRKKVKTPLEFAVSVARATSADVQNPMQMVQSIAAMGMPLYQKLPPTGYSTSADAWMSSAALLDRLNFATSLMNNNQPGIKVDPLRVLALGLFARARKEDIVPVNTTGGTDAAVALIQDALIGGDVSKSTQSAIQQQLVDPQTSAHVLDDPAKTLGLIVGLTLGSPEFQLH